MNQEERNWIEIEDLEGNKIEAEIITTINSKKEDKTYIIFTTDKEIKEDVNINYGYIHEKDNRLNIELINNQEEINYINKLINEEVLS